MSQMTEDEARTEYARWFVKEHYLRKMDDGEHESIVYGRRDYKVVEDARRQKCISTSWYSSGHKAANPGSTGYETFVVNLADLSTEEPARDEWWFRQAWNEYHDALPGWERYRTYLWLMDEAEWHRVNAEAYVRSYGVDVTAP